MNQLYMRTGNAGYVLNVTWSEVVLLRRDSTEQLLVVGRRGCPACARISVRLKELANQYEFNIYVYDTTRDRVRDPAALERRLRAMKVAMVPTILLVGGGKTEVVPITDPELTNVESAIIRLQKRPDR